MIHEDPRRHTNPAIFFVCLRVPAWILFLIIGLAALLPVAPPTRAQSQPALSLNVRPGYSGAYRLGEWFPVVVDIRNDGPDVRATLEWSVAGRSDDQVFQRLVDLPRGSRKRVVLNVYTASFVRGAQLRLLDGSTELLLQDVPLESVDEGVFLIGVVSSDPALLNSLSTLQITGFSTAQVRHLSPADLPESPAELRGLNALFLHDLESAALTPAQLAALDMWAGLGGQLVVSGGAGGQLAAAGLIDILPVAAVGAPAQGDLTPLAQLAGADASGLPAGATISQAQARAGAERLTPGGLLLRRPYGAGLTTFSAFDLASLRGWPGESALWGQVLRLVLPLTPGAGGQLSQFNLLDRGVLKLPSLSLPSPWTLVLFMLVYVLLIGPLNYVLLRRMRRLELAWITVPVVVVLFTVGLYVVGITLRGGVAQVNQMAVVEGYEGQSRGHATAFIGLFSPQRASYALGFPPATLVTGGPTQLFLNARSAPVVVDEGGATTLDVLTDIASMTTFVAEATIESPVQAQSVLTGTGEAVGGEIRNTGTLALDDALIVSGDSYIQLGALAPGASRRFQPGDLRSGFPNALGLSALGVFERQQLMNLLFDRDAQRLRNPGASINAPFETEGVYLLGWATRPAITPALNGQLAAQNSLTLYVIRLGAAGS